MRKFFYIFLSLLLLCGQSFAKSAIDYDVNLAPARSDYLIGIDNPAGAWAINNFTISDILGLIEDGDLPATITRDTELADFITADSADTLSNKDFLDSPNFAAGFQIGGTQVTSTATQLNNWANVTASYAELNILDGATLDTAELNILDGVTATYAEINILDGVTATTAEINLLDGLTDAVTFLSNLYAAGVSVAELDTLDGITSTVGELNILHGATLNTTELNTLTGVTATYEEINKLDGLDSTTTQLDSYIITVRFADVSTASSIYIPVPYGGTVTSLRSVIDGALGTADVTLTSSIGGTPIAGGALTIAYSGSAAGDVDTATTTADNTISDNQAIRITSSGASTNTVAAMISIVIKI